MTQENRKPRASNYARLYTALGLGLICNPWLMYQVLAQTFGQLWAVFAALLKGQRSIVPCRIAVPFKGCWKVYRGGITRKDSHSWGVLGQRFAYDFVLTKDDSTHGGNGGCLKDYHAFGPPVFAPAGGVVLVAVDHYRDYPYPGEGWIDWRVRDIRGNHVMLQHDEGTFSLIAHLRQGSCCVRRNQRVEAGQQIGECGNSGHSTEPHIHIQAQDRSNFYLALGLPIQFEPAHIIHVEASSASSVVRRFSVREWARTGDLVEPSLPNPQEEKTWQPLAATLTWRDAMMSLWGTAVSVTLILFIVRGWKRLIVWLIS